MESVYGNSEYKQIQEDLLAQLKRLRTQYKVPEQDPVRPPRKPRNPKKGKKK